MENVAVIGGGQMGSQIAALSAMSGHKTSIYDNNKDYLNEKLVFTKNNIENLVSKKILDQKKYDNYIENLEVCETLEDTVKNKTFVIEAVVERFEIKKEIFEKISNLLDENVVLATNSSFIAASEIARTCKHPERFLNMHFFYPPLRMDLIEISFPESTKEEVVNRTKDISKLMGRTVVTLKKETPGFIVNRMLGALIDEAYELYDEGIADFKEIDLAIKKGLNHPLGPFELTDYSGLDISYYSKLKIYNETKNPKDKPKKFLEEKVKDGKLGVKTGEGFYSYDKSSKS